MRQQIVPYFRSRLDIVRRCEICNLQHLTKKCNLVHYQPMEQQTIMRHNFYVVPKERIKFERKAFRVSLCKNPDWSHSWPISQYLEALQEEFVTNNYADLAPIIKYLEE